MAMMMMMVIIANQPNSGSVPIAKPRQRCNDYDGPLALNLCIKPPHSSALHDGRPVSWCWRALANSATVWAGSRLVSFIHSGDGPRCPARWGTCSGCVRTAAGAPPHRGGARGGSFGVCLLDASGPSAISSRVVAQHYRGARQAKPSSGTRHETRARREPARARPCTHDRLPARGRPPARPPRGRSVELSPPPTRASHGGPSPDAHAGCSVGLIGCLSRRE